MPKENLKIFIIIGGLIIAYLLINFINYLASLQDINQLYTPLLLLSPFYFY